MINLTPEQLLRCHWCKKEKPTSEFYKSRKTSRGYQYRCKTCGNVYQRTTRGGASYEEYEELLRKYDHRCCICNTPDPGTYHGRFCVDHDHERNFIRGILCNKCNMAIGLLRDSPKLLKAAAQYIEDSWGLYLFGE